MIGQLAIHSECELFGTVHKIVGYEYPFIWLRRPDGESIKFNYMALVTHETFKPGRSMITQKRQNTEVNKLDDDKRDEVSVRFAIIHPLLLLEKMKGGDIQAVQLLKEKYGDLISGENLLNIKQKDLIDKLEKLHDISKATIARYLKAYREHGLDGLISNKGKGYTGRKDNKILTISDPNNPDVIVDTVHVRLTDEQIILLKRTIEQDYLTKLRVSSAALHRII